MKIGTVKEYDRRKGFGFISGDDNQDYFVHVSGLGANLKIEVCLKARRFYLILILG